MTSLAVVAAALLGLIGPESASDVVTLRDGKAVRGEVVEPSSRGVVTVLVRRSWARANLPEWAERWEAAEAPAVRRATAQRRERLAAWRRERPPATDDRITPWIDRELTRLADADARSLLTVVKLAGKDVRGVTRAPKGRTRLLRLAWLSHLPDPETMPLGDLSEALEGRGYDVRATDPVPVENLRPLQPETEAAWLLRRASTEVSFDPGRRFVRHQGVVLPEPPPGQPIAPGTGLAALSALKDLLNDSPADPVTERLKGVEARGGVGALVTGMDLAPDLNGVTVEITLWVRQRPGRWVPSGTRSARVRTDALGPGAGNDLAGDPQVATLFQAVEALGLGGIPPELKARSLAVGAATRRALGQARAAAEADLASLALPVLEAPRAGPRP